MKILVKAVAGSHLFGTNTEKSDRDFKGVFLPTKEEILLGKFDQTIHQHTNNSSNKNTQDDVDIEFYSLDKFLKMLYQGQTVAWELLFTPDSMILEKHPLWDEIRAAAPLFLNKKVDAFIGYCRQQAHKYGIRGSRMNTVHEVLRVLSNYDYYVDFGKIRKEDMKKIENLEHVEWLDKKFQKTEFKVLSICGKKFALNTKLMYIAEPLQKYYDEYGERSKLARQNQGIDWKALSHAVRVCMQGSSLLRQGKIELPMHRDNITLLKGIKAGQLTFEVVANLIEEYQDQLLRDREASVLREEPNLAAFQAIQTRIYEMVVKGEV